MVHSPIWPRAFRIPPKPCKPAETLIWTRVKYINKKEQRWINIDNNGCIFGYVIYVYLHVCIHDRYWTVEILHDGQAATGYALSVCIFCYMILNVYPHWMTSSCSYMACWTIHHHPLVWGFSHYWYNASIVRFVYQVSWYLPETLIIDGFSASSHI